MHPALKLFLVLLFATPLVVYAALHRRADEGGKVRLRYMAWGSPEQQEVDYYLLQEFERRHPDIKVDFILVPSGDYARKLQIMLVSHTEPDVFKMDLYYLPKYHPYGYFTSLDEFDAADDTFSFDDFYPITKAENTYQGKIYGLNTLFGGRVLYYNKALFQKAGLPDPYEQFLRGEWDLAAFVRAAKALTKADSHGVTQFGLKLDTSDLWWITWAFGGDIIDKNHNVYLGAPETLAAIHFYNDLQHAHHVMPLPGEDAGGVFSFESGRLGMYVSFQGETPRFRRRIKSFDWDVVPVPSGPAGHFSLMKGNGLIISARTPHKAEAWELIKFLDSPESEMAYGGPSLRRALPTRLIVPRAENNGQRINREDYLSPVNPKTGKAEPPLNAGAFLDLHASGRAVPVTDKWQAWQQEFGKWNDRLHRGTVTPEAYVQGLAEDVRAVLGLPRGPRTSPIGVPPPQARPGASATTLDGGVR